MIHLVPRQIIVKILWFVMCSDDDLYSQLTHVNFLGDRPPRSPGVDPKQLAAELQKVSQQQAPLSTSSSSLPATTSATSSPGQPGSPSVSKKRHSSKASLEARYQSHSLRFRQPSKHVNPSHNPQIPQNMLFTQTFLAYPQLLQSCKLLCNQPSPQLLLFSFAVSDSVSQPLIVMLALLM